MNDNEKNPKSSNLFKIVLFIIGIFVFLFGIMGGLMELSADEPSTTGLILAPFFMGLGILFVFLSKRRKKIPSPITHDTEKPSMEVTSVLESELISNTEENQSAKNVLNVDKPPWERTYLIVSAYIEIIFILLGIAVALFFGYAGFKGGEMGLIIGVMMFMAFLIFAAFISIRVVALRGILKNRRWAASLNFGLMAVLTILMLILLNPLCIYTAFVAWCSCKLSKHPSFK